jgi:choline transport protein
MASTAEYCDTWFTAGSQQFYTQVLAPESCKQLLSYGVGWCVLVGEISTSSSRALNNAQIIASFAGITHPEVKWEVTYRTLECRARLANALRSLT